MEAWPTFLSVLSILTAVAAVLVAYSTSGAAKIESLRKEMLTIREHKEFKGRVREYKKDMLRELRHLSRRLTLIETTRPTTGELQGAASSLKEQLLALERRIEEASKAVALQQSSTAAALARKTEK
jgi:predicted NACHT family NTPase